MSLAGYRDLATLRHRILPEGMSEDWEYDDDLRDIGLGVAAQFDRITGRTLRRTIGAVYEGAADQEAVVISCYPIQTLTKVEIGDGETMADITSSVIGRQASAGIVLFAGAPGSAEQTLRITVTGGYWCVDTEGGDTTPPAGVTELPADLLDAWFRQVSAACQAENLFRTKGAGKPDSKAALDLNTLTLLPGVRQTLQLYTRMG